MSNAVEFLKDNIDVVELLKHYNTKKIHILNNQIRCCCPIHDGNNPTAFVFNLKNKLWFCHTGECGGGDIYDLVMLLENIDFISAVNKVAEIFNIDISNMEIKLRTNKVLLDTKQWIETMRKMFNSKDVKQYDISVLGELRPINSYRQFDREILEYFNIQYALSNQRIIVPIYQHHNLVGVTMRRTNNHPAKWIHQPTGLVTGNYLYNIDNIKQSDSESIIVCEGCWDVLSYHKHGYTNAVATFGCHLTSEQEKTLLQNTYNVTLSYDSDEAGIRGTLQAIKSLRNKVNIKVANIPDGKDAGELNKEEIENAITNSLTIFEWSKLKGLSIK